MVYRLSDGELLPPAKSGVIEEVISNIGVNLPGDYWEFIRIHNGGEGFIGTNYIVFWKAEELVEFNHEYEVMKYAPGILLFGSDGGGEGYGFDLQAVATPIIRVPFIGMDRRYAIPIANSFPDLFAKLRAPE
ncbi:SMI1/KNR4 family protein [Sphingomonas sp. CFBP 13720]|uniref:SMI1/KNR4 family protein n=1 Tax=Sphingomonas sp. CFBP 13720 TaxID=2775302 RepID=UPI00177F46F6|nr:SMI1/KNR4 family protein [Sphingomonas sp. CFBP 13720]MBD8679369.1 SMI1/KNR4 family protein [Sphingomonas sp. CFBP 13720]